MRLRSVWLAALAFLFLSVLARRAHAQRSSLEDRVADGDLDAEDLARIPALGRRPSEGAHLLAQTWVSLVGFIRDSTGGAREIGAMAVVGVALDKVAQGRERAGPAPVARVAYGDDVAPRSAAPRMPDAPRLALDAPLARGVVRAAWRAAGIEVNDARIDDMIARSRLSAVLPEARFRVVRMAQDAEHATTYVNEAGTVVDTLGSTLTLEARLTWRFDRLLYADDESSLERLRLEREDARSRIGGRVLELLFVWQRALLDAASTEAGSRAELDATLRRYEAEISLDVLTAGWFGAQLLARGLGQGAGTGTGAGGGAGAGAIPPGNAASGVGHGSR